MAWVVNAEDIVGRVFVTSGMYHDKPVKGEFDLIADFKPYKNLEGGFITVAKPLDTGENRKIRVNVAAKGRGYRKVTAAPVERLMTVRELADSEGVSVDVVRGRLRRGKLAKRVVDGVVYVVL